MKHLLYLLLAGSLLTEQPLYGAKKKGKKTRKIGKKGTIGKKGGASSVAVATSQPLTPTPTQTTKTEAPQTAVITKQQAQKLIDGYLEKFRKEILFPIGTLAVRVTTNEKLEKLENLVTKMTKTFINIGNDPIQNIKNLITIFDDKNNINHTTAKELKAEFNKIVEKLKEDLPNKIKENKTEEQKIVQELEKTISDNLKNSMAEKNDGERKKLQIEMARLQKEKKTIEEQYPQCIETILTIHKATLSFFENDILKDFFEKLIKENSTKESLKKKEKYKENKENIYQKKIKEEKDKRRQDTVNETKEAVEEAITKLEKEVKKENDTEKKQELLHQIRQLKERKSKGTPLKYGQKVEGEEKITIDNKVEQWKDEDFWKAIKELDETRMRIANNDGLKTYVKTVLKTTLEIDENKMIANEKSKKRLSNLITKIINEEQTKGHLNESDYTNTLVKIKNKISAFDIQKKEKNDHKAIYDVIENIGLEKQGSNFFNGRQQG
jgi:hypothetical protein